MVFLGQGNHSFFLDSQPFFEKNETLPHGENIQFMLNLIQNFKVENIDFLACDTLNYTNWVNFYNTLASFIFEK